MGQKRAVYRERTPKVWFTTCVAIYVGGMSWAWADAESVDVTSAVIVSVLYFFLLLPLIALPVMKFIYYRIRLTVETLQVGRDRFPVHQIDPRSVLRAQQQTGWSETQRALAHSIPVVGKPAYIWEKTTTADVAGPDVRPLGGRRTATPATMRHVYLTSRDGEVLVVAARRPEALLAALAQVLGT